MTVTKTGAPYERPGDAARAIANLDCDANLRLAQRTRRRVRDEVISTQERRMSQRHSVGLALTGFFCLLVLLAPAIWVGMEDVLGDEHMFDMPTEVAFLITVLLFAMLAALVAVWKGQHNVQHDRRGFETFSPFEK
jgi:hypothetical protein